MLNITNEHARDLTGVDRVGVHSHIRGLGVSENLEPRNSGDGLVSQQKARKAAAIVTALVKEGKIAGRAVLLSGQSGSGKTAIALAIARALGDETPFTHLAGSEVFSLEMGKSEVLTQALRKSVGVKIKETTEVLEGELVELAITRAVGPNGVREGSMTLRTTDIESLYNLGPKMIESLERQGITAGDVISVDKASGKVTKIGRSILKSTEFDAIGGSTKFVKCPEGEIRKTREVVHTVTLHDIDVINSRAQGFLALFAGDTGEIRSEVRTQIDQKVAEWRSERKAEIAPGVLFIDEVHMLDLDCFSFLNRALESESAPVLVMATNRGVTTIRGSGGLLSPHGVPIDLLDRALIIPTEPYNLEELAEIIGQRVQEEDAKLSEPARALLTQIAANTSLRYALQLVSLASLAAAKRKAPLVEEEDINKCFTLFLDVKRSTEYLQAYQNQFLYSAK